MNIKAIIAEKEKDLKNEGNLLSVEEPLLTLNIYPEGKTEFDYFIGVKDYKEDLNINRIVEIEPVSKKELQDSYAKNIVKKMIEIIERGFSEGDLFCIVFDKDIFEKKAKKNDFLEILSLCKKYDIRVLLTNPNFEFWLLLHLDKQVVSIYKEENLLKNPKNHPKEKKRLLEKILSKKMVGYNKANLQFERFKDRIRTAIENEKDYEQNISNMGSKLGSNIGLFLEEIMNSLS
jgi:hypothetical protein